VWDLTGGSTRERLGLPGPEGGLGGVVFSPNAETLAASRGVGLVTLWTFPGGQEVQTIKGPGEAVDSITFDPEGRFLAVAGLTGVQLFDTVEGDVTNVATGVEAGDIAFSSTGLLATSAADGVRLWTVPPGLQGELLSDLGGYGVAFDPTGEIVVMSLDDGEDGFVEIRDVGSGELLASLDEHQAPVWRIEFSPDGSLFATAGLDSRTILWDAATFEPVKTLEGHVGQVFGVAFDPIRAEVATASDDGTIKIWDLETGAVRLILEGTPFSGVDYSPDGRYLAATGPEGFVTVFILDVEELVETAEQRLTRWWAPRECRQYLQSETCPDPPEDFKGSVATG
jgi:WD40 repeat protein